MQNQSTAKLLRIFLGESDKYRHQLLYEVLVYEAKKCGLSGATVTRAVMGFGANSIVHSTKLLELSADLPVVVEVVDTEEKIEPYLSKVNSLFEESRCGGLITLEKVEVIRYGPGSGKKE